MYLAMKEVESVHIINERLKLRGDQRALSFNSMWTLLGQDGISERRCVAAQYQYGPKFYVDTPHLCPRLRADLRKPEAGLEKLQLLDFNSNRQLGHLLQAQFHTFQYVEFSGISPEPHMAIPVPNYFPRNREAYHATKCGRAERVRLLEGRERLIILGEGLPFYFYWLRRDCFLCELIPFFQSNSKYALPLQNHFNLLMSQILDTHD